MANQPKPESFEEVLGAMLAGYMSRTGVNDLNTGSATTAFFETTALAISRASNGIFQVLRDASVDRAEGESLRRIATDENLAELPARVASGQVTISDTSFVKISTKIYAGSQSPNVGTLTLRVSDASAFPTSGALYIGRGTPNVEGPISFSATTPVGGYWEITLSSPTTKFHNINEAVTLSQGGVRSIPVGTIVRSPASGASPDVNFSVSEAAFILDGETEALGVKVSAQEPGTVGNVPIGAIRQFGTSPFPGAAVANALPFKTGRDVETDDELRIRIKRARLSRGLGTALAVKNAVIGATPADEAATVVSSEIVSDSDGTILYVDDGTGYEQKTAGVGIEYIVDSALGGENYFQLETGGRQTSIAKAFLESNLKAPFDIMASDRLAVTVGGITTEHVFQASDFISQGGATAFEIVASINANSALNFEAATSAGGTQVTIQAREEDNETIQVAAPTSGRDAAVQLGFPSNEVQTLRLFKNKQPLSKDGNLASVSTERQVDWSPSIVTGDTLILSVDGTANISYSILDADFIAEGTHSTVSPTNTLESWVAVLNAKLTGVTASAVGEQIVLTSNLGPSNRANVTIDPSSTLVTKNMFSVSQGLISQGKQSDYELSRNTAQIRLNTALAPGDELTAGTNQTAARVESNQILGGVVTLSANAYLWLLIDDAAAEIVRTAVSPSTLIAVSKPTSNVVRYTSAAPSAFSNVQIGDYVIVWSEELSVTNRLEGRVNAVTSTTLDIKVTPSEFSLAVAESGILFQEGFVIIRTRKVPQKLKVTSGTKTLNQIASELNSQLDSAVVSVLDDEILIVSTNTRSGSGAVLIATFDEAGKAFGFIEGSSDLSKDSLVAFYESGFKDGQFPSFIHSSFASGVAASPPDTFITSILSALNLGALGLDPNYVMAFLQPYGAINDALSPEECTFVKNISGATVTLDQDSFVKRLRSDDRYFLANPLQFGHDDDLVVVLDNDATNKTFSMPLFRKALTNTTLAPNATQFNAYDSDGGPTNPFSNFFGTSFDFSNFKVLMRAKNVINPAGAQNAILYRAAQYGTSGERTKVGYSYPTAPNSPITSTVSVGSSVDVKIALKSGALVATSIDGSTEWDVTITPNTPVAGVDQVTYTYSGTGTAPVLSGLSGGEYVNITKESEFAPENTGIYRLSTLGGFTPTLTSFTVVRANGEAVAEAGRATLVPGAVTFYSASATTAAEIVAYVSANLANFISASLVDDSGLSGSGTISLSTAEENLFASDSVQLVDGINWILSSNIGGSPQFTLKRSLALFSGSGYNFNSSEEVILVPTTVEQVSRFYRVLAVTGFTTSGEVALTNREGRLELSTDTLGGSGSIQVVGGFANSSQTSVVGTSSVLEDSLTKSSTFASGLQGLSSDQLVKLTAGNKQRKETLISASSSIKVDSDSPSVGQSTVTLLNRQITGRHFGRPKAFVRTEGRTFKIERQGDFTCISWNGIGSSPLFQSQIDTNDSVVGTFNVQKLAGTSEAEYTILTGGANFSELSIGDYLEVLGSAKPENSGTFLVTGVSESGSVVRVLNANAVDEFSTATITITNNADIAGDDFVVGINSLEAGVDFAVGATASDSAANLASAISALPGVSASALGAVVTVTADTPSASISVSYVNNVGASGATVSSASLVGTSYGSGDFSATVDVREGDLVSLSAPFNILNQGSFRVIARYENSIFIDNQSSVEEEITLSSNPVSLGYDGTTEFDVVASGGQIKLQWNGAGTEPLLGSARMGDILTVGTDFDPANQGSFMITKSQAKLKQVTKVVTPQGSVISGGQYWTAQSANGATDFYVWYQVNGGGSDPALVGFTGILVAITSGMTAAQVATATAAALDAQADFVATSSDNVVRVTNADFGPAVSSTNFNVAGLTVETLVFGTRTYLEALNPAAVSETGILVTDVLSTHRPQMQFFGYETTVPGDLFYVNSTFLGSANQSSWLVEQVLDRDTIVVTGTMASADPTSLFFDTGNVFVEEEFPYVGYKKISLVSIDPANPLRGIIVFSTRDQANKINEDAAVTVSAVGKLSFNSVIRKGLDSYRYHTGLIGEANRILYGDPRDPSTYPGVAAAGAEIFTKPPLFRRVSVAIDVRIETGIPFAQIVEQVRTNVSALVEGNPIGQPIAISDIVASVNAIPGVKAVAISSPLYNSLNDTIKINPSEKARIIDPVVDVSVSEIG